MLDAVNNKKAVPDDFAYVVFTPDDDDLQVIAMAAGSIPKNGNLEIIKKDNHGKVKDNATFHITGPGGTWDKTTNGGKIEINDIPIGTYTITETQAPDNMNNEALNRTVEVEVKPSETITYTRVNNYQRGSVSLTKYDSLNRGATKGDATLKGAEFELHAASDIKEGETKIYSANDFIAKVVTDENGETPKIDNLPIGNYYYIETKASDGFYINNNKISVSVTYAGQYANVAAEGHNEAPEEPEFNSLTIIKKMSETSNTPEKYLEGCEFTATLKSNSSFKIKSVYLGNGEYKIQDLPYGLYTIEETVVNPYTLKMENFDMNIKEGDKKRGPYKPIEGIHTPNDTSLNISGEVVDITKGMYIKIRKVDYDRTDDQRVDWTQGDAQLKGAIYEIKMWNEADQAYTTPVYDITVDHKDENGYWVAESEKLIVGKYMVKEKYKSTETIDGVTYYHSYAEGYLVDPEPHYFEQKPEEQVEELSYHSSVSKEKVQRGAVYVVKYDNDRSNEDIENDSDKVPSAGAILRLTLNSNPDIYYTVKLNDKGEGEFIETNDSTHTSTALHDSMSYYPYTIPYGEYTITEDKEADGGENTSFYIQPEIVNVPKQAKKEYRIEADEPVPAYIKITKKDSTTSEIVGLPNTTFKIWDVAANRWLTMKAGVGIEIDEFSTNSDGYLYTPQKVNPGEYIVYETNAPKGYFLNQKLRIPSNANEIGKIGKGGQLIKVDKISTGLAADAINSGNSITGDLEYGVDVKDQPLYVNIKILKTAERLKDSRTETVTYTESDGTEVELEKNIPIYEDNIGLEGVGYKIYSEEDIYTPDGVLRTTKGTLVDDITTNSEGIAQSRKDLFPGKYKVVEYKVPKGYLLDSTPKYVLAENSDQYVESATTTLELNDKRQKLSLQFEKEFKEGKYFTGDELKYAVFGVYTKETIKNYKGLDTILSDKLVDLLIVEDNGIVKSTADLPQGEYEVKEIYAEFPYEKINETQNFSLKYNDDGVTPEIVEEGEKVVNDYVSGTIHFVKLSTTINDTLIIKGSDILTEGLNEKAQEIISSLKGKTNEEIEQYFKDNPVSSVKGAKYEIWLDELGSKKVYQKDENGNKVVAVFETNGYGAIDISDLPIGTFYLKEIEAPEGYEVSEELVKFTLNLTDVEESIYQAIFDDSIKTQFLHKTDFFTGENVPNCNFEIRDEDGKLILNAITGEDGIAWIPNDAFEPYRDKPDTKFYYTEIDAPDVYKEDGKLYKLNTEPHEFSGIFDEETGKFTVELTNVENLRPTTNVKLIKTDEEDNLVPNCKFELKSEEENLFYETGVTDENGIYVFENVPQGWYTYTELEAPEEYDLDTTPHRIYVTGDEMIIEFVNTGDIPVVAIAIVAVVCIAGIAFVIIRKKMLNN